jgi:hypothetical protein
MLRFVLPDSVAEFNAAYGHDVAAPAAYIRPQNESRRGLAASRGLPIFEIAGKASDFWDGLRGAASRQALSGRLGPKCGLTTLTFAERAAELGVRLATLDDCWPSVR